MELYIVKVGKKYIEEKWIGTCRLVNDIKHATKYTSKDDAEDSIRGVAKIDGKYLNQKKYILTLKVNIAEEVLWEDK